MDLLKISQDTIHAILTACLDYERMAEQYKKQHEAAFECLSFEDYSKQQGESQMLYVKEGSVVQRKDGRYIARLYLFGKQRQVAIGHMKHKVIQRLNEIAELKSQKKINSLEELFAVLNGLAPLADVAEATEQTNEGYTLHSWLDTWLETFKHNQVSNNYFIQLRSNIKVHIKPNIADAPLAEVSTLAVQKGLNNIQSPRMKENSYVILKESAQKALDLQLIAHDFTKGITYKKHKRTARAALTALQQQRFEILAQQTELGRALLFQLYTGCRPNEILREKWEYINLEKNTIFIDGTKNEYAKRTVPIFKKTRELIAHLPKTDEFIFTYSNTELRDEFNRIMTACGFEGFDRYCLRHCFATRMNEIGVDVVTIALWLGHNDTTTTKRTYIESQIEHQAALQIKIDKLF